MMDEEWSMLDVVSQDSYELVLFSSPLPDEH